MGAPLWRSLSTACIRKSQSVKDEQPKKLATVLRNTGEGVEELTNFLDAMKKLAVTSLQVFTDGGEVESVSGFVEQFSECHPRMLQFLDDTEGCAVQLDRMKKGSEIS
ncbi:unnamed protein product [Gadus morhua 'NCC']